MPAERQIPRPVHAPAVEARPPDDRSRAVKGGVVGGIVGGIALALFLVLMAGVNGTPAAAAFKGAALPLFGPERVSTPVWEPGVVALGTLMHFAVSIVWGLLFALLVYGMSRAATLVSGLFWGLVVWLGMFYVLLPLVGGFGVTQGTPLWQAIVMHMVFGLATAAGFLPFQRMLPRKLRPLDRGRSGRGRVRPPITEAMNEEPRVPA